MSDEVENRKRSSTPDLLDSDSDQNAANKGTTLIANESEPTNETDNISELPHIVELENSAQNITNKIQSASLKDNESLASKTQTNNCQYKVTCTIIKSSFTEQQESFAFTLNSDCNEITAILNNIKTTATSFLVGLNDEMLSQQDRLASALSSPQSNQSAEALNCEKNPETDASSIVKIFFNELQTTSQRRDLLKNQNVHSQSMSDPKREVNKAEDSERADNVYIEVDKTERGFRLTIHMATSHPAQTSAKSGDNAKPQQCITSPDSPLLRIDVETVPETETEPIAIKTCEETETETTNQEAENEPESDISSNESNGK